jgi:hypothetical protein
LAELAVRLDLDACALRGLLAAALLAAAAPELASESLPLTTYYPAPVGAYGQLVVAGNALLARQVGAKVMVGPGGANQTLDVAGSIHGLQTATFNAGVDVTHANAASVCGGPTGQTLNVCGAATLGTLTVGTVGANPANVLNILAQNVTVPNAVGTSGAGSVGGSEAIHGNLTVGATGRGASFCTTAGPCVGDQLPPGQVPPVVIDAVDCPVTNGTGGPWGCDISGHTLSILIAPGAGYTAPVAGNCGIGATCSFDQRSLTMAFTRPQSPFGGAFFLEYLPGGGTLCYGNCTNGNGNLGDGQCVYGTPHKALQGEDTQNSNHMHLYFCYL